MLSKLSELITEIKNDEQIQRFKELEKVIDHNESLREDFNTLLNYQKVMVGKEYKKDSSVDEAREKYEKQLEVVLAYPVIEEYLELLDLINSDLRMIRSIIEQEIAKDFD